jgi:hypothetical protein
MYMEWHAFLSDPDIDTNFGYQSPEQHFFGKMVHDVLASLHAMLSWIQLVEEMKVADDLPAAVRDWLVRNAPNIQQESTYIQSLATDFLTATNSSTGWLKLVDTVGTSALRIGALKDKFAHLPKAPSARGQDLMEVIRHNLVKLTLLGQDIQSHEYKRLWTVRYDDLVQMQ